MEWLIEILLILLFLVLKGFFSGSEIAMVNSDKLKLRHQARLGNRRAALVLELFKKPDHVLGTTLVGTNVATVTIATLGALICIDLFGTSGDLISIILLTPILLILGEVVPKSIFQQKADEIVSRIVYALRFFSHLFYPIIFIFARVARLGTRLAGGGVLPQDLFITREELRVLLDPSEAVSDRSTIDRRRIRRIIRFADTTVGEAMIPLAEVVGFNEMRNTKEAIRTVLQHGYNRLPVYRGNITNVKGVLTLSTWDLMNNDLEREPITDYISTALYLSPRQTIDQALPLLQARRDHMAIVVDEFGSAVGILTMEDVFEEVVGEIDVGYDFDEYQPKRRIYIERESENVHVMAGRMPLSEVNDILHLTLPVQEALTIGGFVINRLKRIAEEGDFVEESGCRVTVIEADSRSVTKVKVERL
ncbi:MAG: hemolysin family protein [Pseudomonadales bacterium]|jgi:CBS domain containing-hemolysin-like protein|nr:hemolysin family protein [Pseudomonadales bacterium]MDP7146887.1 hemolysin family protein [Pseudomonadales bacterium]MDP7359866.1 hemolysin family protein [Pseudomonadales bacterium]MDP7594004.1 hemolysin family protein [Pseudomonadales bacterium]HJN48840.1 hemolysin family protein [Pseudomonadales bacterium]|tara:strand:+ start:8706 stop:9965 length:1260 start_codon:yes stop_codon:yes gene_type:complete